jgi:hypothetical protein
VFLGLSKDILDYRSMDKIIYPICMLCRDYERAGFAEEIKIGIRLHQELSEL